MNQLIDIMLERVRELNLKSHQKFRVEVSQDVMDEIIHNAEEAGCSHQKLDDGSYIFIYPGGGFSPKMFVIDHFKKGEFRITLVDE